MTPVGKYDKRRLREQLAEELAAGARRERAFRPTRRGYRRRACAHSSSGPASRRSRSGADSSASISSSSRRRRGRTLRARRRRRASARVLITRPCVSSRSRATSRACECGEHLVHRLWCHQRASRELRVREAGTGAKHGQRRVLPDRQTLRADGFVEPPPQRAVEPPDHVADSAVRGRASAGHSTAGAGPERRQGSEKGVTYVGRWETVRVDLDAALRGSS